MPDLRRPRYVYNFTWNVALAILIYVFVVIFVQLSHHPLLRFGSVKFLTIEVGDKEAPAIVEYTDPQPVGAENPIQIKYAALPYPVTVNRYANFYNRPASLVEPRDAYLGQRPHVDTEINFEELMRGCRGDFERLSQYKNTSNCLDYLKNNEERYTTLPSEGSRASNRDPRLAEYLNSDGHDNRLDSYVPVEAAEQPSNSSRGTCPGPIVPYHVYWRGPATWRVELFIKAYLYTQNLPCSQLNLWLDSDPFPNAVFDMMNNDPLFSRFVPLVDRGDIILREWHFPSRIPLPKPDSTLDSRGDNETIVAPRGANWKRRISYSFGRGATDPDQLILSEKEKSFLPVAVSDAVRFVVLHLYGGGYFDMDVVMLRDMRPFYLPQNHSFAERWSTYTNGGFNTAIMSLTANSSLSTYYLQGGIKMGLNFHPLILGIMSRKDGRNSELQMMEHGVFDPLWGRYAGVEEGPCPVPCFQGDYSRAFKGGKDAIKGEWRSYTGPRLEEVPLGRPKKNVWKTGRLPRPHPEKPQLEERESGTMESGTHARRSLETRQESSMDEEFLIRADIITDYNIEEDGWPPTNRTLENFFRGAYTYHVHNQWNSVPEPSSWLNVIERAHDRFFAGKSTNPYGETWTGPYVATYRTWAEFL